MMRPAMPAVTLHDILGPAGAIARKLGQRYEHRPQQSEMAEAVQAAFTDGHHLMVEAGTGVGKSFAYLLPAIDYAVRNKKRVVISTHTISLQEQLIEKDIPLLRSVYPADFSAVLVKGRNNYLCQRRLEQAGGRAGYLFETDRQVQSLTVIEDWVQRSFETGGGGSLSELPHVPDPTVWDKVCAEAGNCLGKKCPHYKGCFWQAARKRMLTADVLVVNHALLFSDLALRMAGVQYLPKYDLLVLDEAHTVEDVAGQHFGLKVTEAGVRYALRSLFDGRRGKGALTHHGTAADPAVKDVVELNGVCDRFFDGCANHQAAQGRGGPTGSSGRVRSADVVPNELSPKLRDLSLHLKEMLAGIKDEAAVAELTNAAAKVGTMAEATAAIVGQTIPDAVYWFDVAGGGRQQQPRRVSLHAAPVNVGDGLRRYLFDTVRSVVMTSATLCTTAGKTPADEFKYVKDRLGVPAAHTLRLGSPFDYATQATVYLEVGLPEPSSPAFLTAACDRIAHYLRQSHGGAFVLFTSYAMLIEAANRLKADVDAMGLPLLVQGQGATRKVLLEQFRSRPNSVLFATGAFWQGIDVQGEALRNVIIVKLPFSVPDEPVTEARLEAITAGGGNAFLQYSVPEAVIKLKQGFGRLIRSRTDTGIVAILDSRVKTKRYGRLFLDALPACRVVEVG